MAAAQLLLVEDDNAMREMLESLFRQEGYVVSEASSATAALALVRETDFDMVTRNSKWFQFASTWHLYKELQKPDSSRVANMAVLFHTRLTRPILALILVVMGLSVLLRDQNRNVFISAGLCLVLCGVFFAAQFACKSLGDSEYVSPALAAWLPVLFFGPFSVAMFDAIHT